MMKKKIAFFTSRFPYPLEKGDKLRAYHHIVELSKKYAVYLFSVTESYVQEEDIEALKPYCRKILIYRIPVLTRLVNLLKCFFTGEPFQVGYFFSESINKKVNEKWNEINPDVSFFQLARMAKYSFDKTAALSILDYQDAFSKGYERQMKRERGIKKILVYMEWKRMKRYESIIFDHFDERLIISEQDRNFINHRAKESITVVPNGVDVNYYAPVPAYKKEFELVFAGNMSYPPNIESALFIIHELMPALWKTHPGARVVIAGANPGREILQLQSDRVEITGWVDDIRTYYHASKIHIAPMLISIGLQNKILQAMAMKIPCIVSPQANNAIHATKDSDVLIAESVEEYVKHIERLLGDPGFYNTITENAYRFVTSHFDWETQVKKIVEIIER